MAVGNDQRVATSTGEAVEAPPTFVRPKQSAIIRYGKRLRDPVNRWFQRQSLIDTSAIVPPAQVPGLAQMQPHWRTIRSEAEALLSSREKIPPFGKISPDHRRIASGPQWKSFFFEGYGFRSEANRQTCPQTAALIDQVPGLVVAFYSIMAGDAHVPRHRGLTKAWLNCHLPLIVPQAKGRCEMQVGEETVRWTEGEWLVFDETHPHEVWNDTGEPRVVLMLQVRRPMKPAGRLAASALYHGIKRTSFVQDVRHALRA